MVCSDMALGLNFARFLAAILVTAAFAMPSTAFAHESHAHHRMVAKSVTASPDAGPASEATSQERPPLAVVSAATPRSAPASAPGECDGHCCGTGMGMTCCGAALVPNLIEAQLVLVSVPFAIRHVPPADGLPPEALPRPPKSFA